MTPADRALRHFSPQWTAPTTPFRNTWSAVGNIDQFRWLARADVLRQLEMARDELGLRHVRAVAMYSPELCVWDRPITQWREPTERTTRQANWQLVDLSLEALIERDLRPIYTTCFTPAGMTDDPTVCWPDRNPTGLPRDLEQWKEFVAAGIRHHLRRYGRSEVRSWYFECWNEPNLRGCFFGGSREDFFRLWSATWHAVKSVDPELRFGGPSTARGEWIPEFLDFAAKDGTPPDYLITHVYNNDSEAQPLSPFDGPAAHRVKDSPHFASGVIRGVRRELDRRGFSGEIHWNEWGRSWFVQDPLKESALEAAFVAKTMAEVSQEADALAFWCLSDIYNQAGFQSSEFDGHYGMLSLHGLRKPSWMAHLLLNRLAGLRVPCTGGDALTDAVASLHGGEAAILLYAYPENPEAAALTEIVSVALPEQATALRLTRIGAEENNVLAAWRRQGSPSSPTREEIEQLRQGNRLARTPASAVRVEHGHATFNLERPGVALLEFRLS